MGSLLPFWIWLAVAGVSLVALVFACRTVWPWARQQARWKGLAIAGLSVAVSAGLYFLAGAAAIFALHGLAEMTGYEVHYAGADAIALGVLAGGVPCVSALLIFAPGTVINALKQPVTRGA